MLSQHLQYFARDPIFTLQRLVGVSIGTQRYGCADIARFSQFFPQQLRRIWFDQDAALEIQPC